VLFYSASVQSFKNVILSSLHNTIVDHTALVLACGIDFIVSTTPVWWGLVAHASYLADCRSPATVNVFFLNSALLFAESCGGKSC
jgi:hypothetical protein